MTTIQRPMNVPTSIPDEGSWNRFLGYTRYVCSVCACTWDGVDQGRPNQRQEWCDKYRCACHDLRFAAVMCLP